MISGPYSWLKSKTEVALVCAGSFFRLVAPWQQSTSRGNAALPRVPQCQSCVLAYTLTPALSQGRAFTRSHCVSTKFQSYLYYVHVLKPPVWDSILLVRFFGLGLRLMVAQMAWVLTLAWGNHPGFDLLAVSTYSSCFFLLIFLNVFKPFSWNF